MYPDCKTTLIFTLCHFGPQFVTHSAIPDKLYPHGTHLKKGLFLTYFSHFLVTREKLQKILQHIPHSYKRILLTILTFFALTILKKIRIYQVRFLFGMSPGVDSYSRHFGTINK